MYAVAVPLTRYSLSAYPTLARSMVVVVSAGVLLPPVTGPPVTGPLTVGTGGSGAPAAAGIASAVATSASAATSVTRIRRSGSTLRR